MQTRTKGGPSCPSCRAEADTRQLQLNHSLAHAVKCFLDARPTLLEAVAASCASQPPVQRSRVRSNAKARLSGNIAPSSTGDEKPTRMTRKRARESTLSKRKEGEETCQDIKIVLEGCTSEAGSDACSSSAGEDSDPDFEPRVLSASRHTPNSRKADPPSDPAQNAMPNRNNCGPPAGKVECPICGGYFPQGETAQKHVEICMVRSALSSAFVNPTGQLTVGLQDDKPERADKTS